MNLVHTISEYFYHISRHAVLTDVSPEMYAMCVLNSEIRYVDGEGAT